MNGAPWAKGFPSGDVSGPSCVIIPRYDHSEWINVNCAQKAKFICKVDVKSQSTEQKTKNDSVIVIEEIDRSEAWAEKVYLGGSYFKIYSKFPTNQSMTWDESKLFCEKEDMSLAYVDTEAKLYFISSILPKPGGEFGRFSRVWLGAVRPDWDWPANGFDFVWTNGRKQNLKETSWQIQEQKGQKCLYTFLNNWVSTSSSSIWMPGSIRSSSKPLFYMTNCEETRLFHHIVCERTSFKQPCKEDVDCHMHAKCSKDRCFCDPGFDGDGYFCSDINECNEVADYVLCPDSYKSKCKNDEGSYYCTGSYTYYPYSSPCDNTECSGINKVRCVNQNWDSFACSCEVGFTSQEAFCLLNTDIQLDNSVYKTDLSFKESYNFAQALCIIEYGDLMALDSAAELNLLQQIFNKSETNLVWLSGPTDKKNDTKLCLALNTHSRISKYVSCDSKNHFLCERKIGQSECQHDLECAQYASCIESYKFDQFTASSLTTTAAAVITAPFQSSHRLKVKKCFCNIGFHGNGTACTDIDECSLGLYTCDSNGTSECINTVGSYFCD